MIKHKNKYYITIKELAEYRQVSVQSIYKLLSTSLSQFSTLVENKKMIDISVFQDYYHVNLPDDILNQFENKFNKVESSIKPDSNSFNLDNNDNNTDIISLLKNQLDDYKEQVLFLKEQIAEKDRQINNLHNLLQAAEELQRNHQILLLHSNNKSNKSDSDSLNAYSDDIDNANIENQTDTKEKKGFFSRFFR